MKIETKYNIGDKVTFKNNNEILEGNIITINIQEYYDIYNMIRGSRLEYEVYTLKGGNSYTLSEKEITKK